MSDYFPSELPIFPLAGALLLPHARLPLMAFEPRYIAMVEDTLSADRLIGMLQPRNKSGELYEIGCSGRIVRFDELEDKRCFIILKGVRRFRAITEQPLAPGGYRRFTIDGQDFALDESSPAVDVGLARERLKKALRHSARDILPSDFDLAALLACGDEEIINLLSILCPFAPSEKQALLEVPTVIERGESLITLLEMEAFTAPTSRQ